MVFTSAKNLVSYTRIPSLRSKLLKMENLLILFKIIMMVSDVALKFSLFNYLIKLNQYRRLKRNSVIVCILRKFVHFTLFYINMLTCWRDVTHLMVPTFLKLFFHLNVFWFCVVPCLDFLVYIEWISWRLSANITKFLLLFL